MDKVGTKDTGNCLIFLCNSSELLPILTLLIIGIAVGMLTGMTGSSGVLIVVPALGIMGLTFQESVGTSLLVDVITTSAVIFVYVRKGSTSIQRAVSMGLGAVIGAQLGARIAVSLPEKPLEIGFVVLTAVLALQMYRRSLKKATSMPHKISIDGRYVLPLAFSLSIPVGILTGTLGTSGGIMFIGIIMILFSMSAQEMVGTATLAMMFSAISGVAGYVYFGSIDIFAALVIGVTSLISGYFFSILAHRVDERKIYFIIGTVFVAVIFVEMFKII